MADVPQFIEIAGTHYLVRRSKENERRRGTLEVMFAQLSNMLSKALEILRNLIFVTYVILWIWTVVIFWGCIIWMEKGGALIAKVRQNVTARIESTTHHYSDKARNVIYRATEYMENKLSNTIDALCSAHKKFLSRNFKFSDPFTLFKLCLQFQIITVCLGIQKLSSRAIQYYYGNYKSVLSDLDMERSKEADAPSTNINTNENTNIKTNEN